MEFTAAVSMAAKQCKRLLGCTTLLATWLYACLAKRCRACCERKSDRELLRGLVMLQYSAFTAIRLPLLMVPLLCLEHNQLGLLQTTLAGWLFLLELILYLFL